MPNSYEKAFDRFAAKWLSIVFKGEWDALKFGSKPQDYDSLSNGARLVFLFTQFLRRAYEEVEDDGEGRPLFVFVTKKGYWLYRCIYHHLYLLPEGDAYQSCRKFWDSIWVRSDRFFTKSPDVSEFTTCQLFIIDDIVHTGANFQRMRQLVQENGLKIAKYVTFAIEDCVEPLWDEAADIWTCSKLSSNDLGKISIEEIILFHSLGAPYTIDLPMLKLADRTEVADRCEYAFSSGRLTPDEFYQLSRWGERYGWKNVKAPYKLNDQNFESLLFWNPLNLVERKFKNLVHSLIVECSYREKELDGGETVVDVTFVPFAIMRSVKWQELILLFSAAFEKTPYYNYILTRLRAVERPSQALATALYRSLVFYLSGYTAVCFNDLLRHIGRSLVLQTEHMEEHWNADFMDSVTHIFSQFDLLRDNEVPLVTCTSIQKFYQSDDIFSDPQYWDAGIMMTTENRALDIHLEMYKFFVKNPGFEKRDHYSFEDLEIKIAVQEGELVNNSKFKEHFLQALTRLLNQSAISNTVYYEQTSDRVIRGFRSGENSALLLPYAQQEVFCAIAAYYGRCERLFSDSKAVEQQYKKQFDYFKEKLLEYVSDTGYDYWIDISEAAQLMDYFKNLSTPGRQIKNRQYIVEELNQDKSSPYAIMIKNLQEFVENLELFNE